MTEHEDLTTVGPATGATVAYKGWVTTASGREAIEIVLPLGAPEYLLEQAIEQWQQMRAAAQRATEPSSLAHVAPAERVLTFGKHQGRRLGEVLQNDRSYVEWLSQAAREAEMRSAANELLAAGRADAPPEPAEQDAGDVPF